MKKKFFIILVVLFVLGIAFRDQIFTEKSVTTKCEVHSTIGQSTKTYGLSMQNEN